MWLFEGGRLAGAPAGRTSQSPIQKSRARFSGLSAQGVPSFGGGPEEGEGDGDCARAGPAIASAPSTTHDAARSLFFIAHPSSIAGEADASPRTPEFGARADRSGGRRGALSESCPL